MIRHDRDARFVSEVFQTFADMMQSRLRATLSYRPQANGQQERSVKSVMASVRVYVEDPLQQDWDELVERLIFAINNSMDTTRKETPFYLVRGWDARSTLRAMASMGRGLGRQSDARAWRREASRQQEIALAMTKEYQASEKKKRAKKHNDARSRMKRTSLRHGEPSDTSGDGSSDQANDAGATKPNERSLFEAGSRAWLYMGRVKPGLVNKLAHLWYGPFRIKAKVEEFAYELELPDRRGYRFHPVVHVSRLKPVTGFEDRPTVRLAPEVEDKHRADLDEELYQRTVGSRDLRRMNSRLKRFLMIVHQCRRVPKDRCESSRSSGLVTMNHRESLYRACRAEDCCMTTSSSARGIDVCK
ncbi:hypothetical protein PI124_g22167 [Phytophthora idaei]|nr:hypothetical protein PI124_g22167 [Phytophthora idaei]